jgi:hypothetical protein
VTAPWTACAELCALPLSADEHDVVGLLVSELVTNSVRYARLGARQRIRVRAHIADTAIRVEVIDGGAGIGVAIRDPEPHGGAGACTSSTNSPTAGALCTPLASMSGSKSTESTSRRRDPAGRARPRSDPKATDDLLDAPDVQTGRDDGDREPTPVEARLPAVAGADFHGSDRSPAGGSAEPVYRPAWP